MKAPAETAQIKTGKRTRLSLRALRSKVQVKGLAVLDRRTAQARNLLDWRDQLLNACGGEANITPQRMMLVELVVRTRLYVDHIDHHLMAMPTLIIKRKKSVVPLLRERQTLCDSLARLLGQLGFERVPKPLQSLQEIIAEAEAEKEQADEHHRGDE